MKGHNLFTVAIGMLMTQQGMAEFRFTVEEAEDFEAQMGQMGSGGLRVEFDGTTVTFVVSFGGPHDHRT